MNDLPLVLRIENMDSLPDGGPLSIELDQRGVDIGRDSYLDWTLPDPQRFISGKHCEVHYRDGGYWLHDVSTNGTTVNDNPGRLTEPYLLKNGDRIHIGDYIVAVELDGDGGAGGNAAGGAQAQSSSGSSGDLWGGFADVAPSVSRSDVTPVTTSEDITGRPMMSDVLEEEISWSVGEVETPAAEDLNVDWATPSGPSPARVEPPPPPSPPPPSPPSPPPPSPPPQAAPPQPGPPEPDWGSPEPVQPSAPEEEPLELTAPSAPPGQPEPSSRSAGLGGQWQDEPASAPPPMPAPPPPQEAPAQAVPQPAPAAGGSWVAAFERGAGLPPGSVARSQGDEALAEEMGQLFRIVTENLKAMLAARDETKSAMRSTQRTMIQAMENNPLKFSPTPEDAMRIMFGEKVRSYLDARETLEASFRDLKTHQMMTFNAMQQALQALIEDLDPERIAENTATDSGLAGLVSSRRAKLWDIYTERYKAKAGRHERGLIDAFMILFAEMYDQQGRR